jgi:hypothetical protein
MSGGGFLGQMHDTMKKNREMVRAVLGKTKRKPFDNGEYKNKNVFVADTTKKLTEEERNIFIARVRAANQKALAKRIFLTIITMLGIFLTIWALPLLYRFLLDYKR